jgi:hypothetical protein
MSAIARKSFRRGGESERKKKLAGTFKKNGGNIKNNARRKAFVRVMRVNMAEHFLEHIKINGSR